MRRNWKLIDIDFEKVVDLFNEGGKAAAQEFIKANYGVDYYLVIRRLKEQTAYRYNIGKRKYEIENIGEEQFLTMEQICAKENKLPEEKITVSKATAIPFETILVDLMKDRMIEISKYIQLEQSSQKITISIDSLKKSGYEVVLM